MMKERVCRLRQRSVETKPSISAERAELLTQFYREHEGKHSVPVLRAMSFQYLCEHKTIFIGEDELIVGERGPRPAVTPTFPELTCHSIEDLEILNIREKTSYDVPDRVIAAYEAEVIPYWRGRSIRDRVFPLLPPSWHDAYEAGVFTEFMEQRAPGHTVADGKIYQKGLLDFKQEIAESIACLDFIHDAHAFQKREQLWAMTIAADAAIRFAQRHAELARTMASATEDPLRRVELEQIAATCDRVPANRPRTFREALQAYWFYHLGVITELNGWDSFNPGHLDHHLGPFYEKETADGTLTRESAKELLECWWIKFNNHPAPPKVGVTAAESGTYTDFANINIGGLRRDGSDAVNEVSYLLLEVIDEMHLLQPSNNIQLSRKNPDRFVKAAARVIRQGYGFPSVFNADGVVEQLLRQGKRVEDAREGGTSGCVESGAFGKEAYILTGYFNLVKVLELTLHNGIDPRTGKQLGPQTGDPRSFASFDELFEAWRQQVQHFVDLKLTGNHVFEQMYAQNAPAPFLSIITDDCIRNGKDYNAGGARYNTNYIQGVGIGSLSDSFSAIQHHVYRENTVKLDELLTAIDSDFQSNERLRQSLLNKTPKYGNDDAAADELMVRCFNAFFDAVEGRPNTKGGEYHIDMLPTTCHVYFGTVTGATADGRQAGMPLSEGISPVQGADRNGPTAVLKSAAKMDHVKTGGTLLNIKFTPQLLKGDEGINHMSHLIRSYFKLDSHHVQFNVVSAAKLREAQADPDRYRDLIVRVAGYSDYFCDLSKALQDEIITRTEHESF
ncbi:trans-4-hydroxy-L-proline dehydratase [Novipirellula artificiosorum]|uniref:Benzylsuccinate synthase alpha subunit n=1 Tax=Novipirellula artificiosorum TaxID=2528016 RepID=A0A5C6D2K1_9BACT|nr:trans-4-hydroxy-L-proline dehydratase [Novipirellula artificiosorum]TWU30968.1 Benzylsuccinate synthase alpha subunit [Novipirellula artificiosorum]